MSSSLLPMLLFSLASLVFTWLNFMHAFPITALKISASSEDVLTLATTLRSVNGSALYRPVGRFEEAVGFQSDDDMQAFMELKGGGNAAFEEVIRSGASGGAFSPFSWQVRHYLPNQEAESSLYFTPSGVPLGFATSIAETEPGADLSPAAALELAKAGARAEPWDLDLDAATFDLVQESSQVQVSGRRDHDFVFECKHKRIDTADGEPGRFRVELRVLGDRFARLRYTFKVPDPFRREYEGMRSSNQAVAQAAWVAISVLYGCVGCVVGVFYLMRRSALLPSRAAKTAAVLSVLLSCASLSSVPLKWLQYDTALSTSLYTAQILFELVANAVFLWLVAWITIMAAEGLGRCVDETGEYGHLQLFSATIKRVAASDRVLDQILRGYLWVPIMFAYEVAFYFVAVRAGGWWTPSSALVDPNVAAMYLPSLAAIGQSLFAGTWEECLFRAVPIAGGLLLARHLGLRQRVVLFGIFAVQAVIFGAAHANYPAQPSYARLVELLVPSVLFGLIYLKDGLLPGMLFHFVYDVVWFAMPLFLTPTFSLILDKCITIGFVVAPLLIVLLLRWSQRPESDDLVLEAYGNKAWFQRPAEETAKSKEAAQVRLVPLPSKSLLAGLAVLFVAVASAGLCLTETPPAVPFRLPDDRAKAAQTAASTIRAAGGGGQLVDWQGLDSRYDMLGAVSDNVTTAHQFVWQTAGAGVYSQLVTHGFLSNPSWNFRFAQFQHDLGNDQESDEVKAQREMDRAEEWYVYVHWNSSAGTASSVKHVLPQGRIGQNLTVDEARSTALACLLEEGIHASEGQELVPGEKCRLVTEVSATPEQLSNRTDWHFVFSCGMGGVDAETGDAANDPFGLPEGNARIRIGVASAGQGKHLLYVERFVKVPDEWQRAKRKTDALSSLIMTAARLGTILAVISAAGAAIVQWSGKRSFPATLFWRTFLLLVVLQLVNDYNTWPQTTFSFSTSSPYTNQVFSKASSKLISAVTRNAPIALALVFSTTQGWSRSQQPLALRHIGATLLPLACLAAALLYLAESATVFFAPPSVRLIPLPSSTVVSALSDRLPVLSVFLTVLKNLLSHSTIALLFFSCLDTVVTRSPASSPLLLLTGGFLWVVQSQTVLDVAASAQFLACATVARAVILLALYVCVFRYSMQLVPCALVLAAVPASYRSLTMVESPLQLAIVAAMLLSAACAATLTYATAPNPPQPKTNKKTD